MKGSLGLQGSSSKDYAREEARGREWMVDYSRVSPLGLRVPAAVVEEFEARLARGA